jgi:hypothetical protein
VPRPKRRGEAAAAPPAWIGEFVPADWDEPDETEQKMIDACPSMRPWPDHLHDHHAHRRWAEARSAWLDAHPEHDHRVEELLAAFGYASEEDWRRGVQEDDSHGQA